MKVETPTNELWLPVNDWPAYEVSSGGNVRRNGKPIKVFYNNHGYLSFNVSRSNTSRKMLRLHREVAKLFVAPFFGPLVRHLDGHKENCLPDNLAWGTSKDNEDDKLKHGRRMNGEKHHQAKLTLAQVQEILKSDEPGTVLAKRFSVVATTVRKIRRRESWRHL